jgi:CRISPR/Cas system endoribonuclease Cas6 (RAMP superfamily)
MLLRFGEFSGCGIKSSMGMGAIAVEAILRKDQAA